MKTTRRQTNKQFRLFAALSCCLMAAHLTPQTGFGQIPIPEFGGGKSEASVLSDGGPKSAAAYLLNDFFIRGFLRGGQPLGLEYRLGPESKATITITAEVGKEQKSFTYDLEKTGDEIKQVVFQVPAGVFGTKPVVATFAVKAENIGQVGYVPKVGFVPISRAGTDSPIQRLMNAGYFLGEADQAAKKQPDFELYGIGMGEKAVGSMGIVNLSFQPARVRATQKQRAAYSFHSRFDFERAYAEFQYTAYTSRGEPANRFVNGEKISGIRRGESVSREWNGKNQKGEVSMGRHQIVVKAWYEEKKGGDWTRAWSQQRVIIE